MNFTPAGAGCLGGRHGNKYLITSQSPSVETRSCLIPPYTCCCFFSSPHVEKNYFWHDCLESLYIAVLIGALVALIAVVDQFTNSDGSIHTCSLLLFDSQPDYLLFT